MHEKIRCDDCPGMAVPKDNVEQDLMVLNGSIMIAKRGTPSIKTLLDKDLSAFV